MGRHVAGEAPELDALVDEAMRGVGAEIAALRVPRLWGVVLGGGYGRGEGGAMVAPDGAMRLSNDLDFFAVTEEGAPEAETVAAISAALAPVAEKWGAELGVDVDFAVKTPWRLRHDQERVMVQELVRGHFDVAGAPGAELFAGVERRGPEAFPWMEAARLLMNRGVGLLLAAEAASNAQCTMHDAQCARGNAQCARGNAQCARGNAQCTMHNAQCARGNAQCTMHDAQCARGNAQCAKVADDRNEFVLRNINKCVLGAGDARLIAYGRYAWRVLDRAEALGDPLYSAAVEWKFRPRREGVCDWETARRVWLEALAEVEGAAGATRRRTPFNAARWVVRRKSLGEPATFGLDPVVRVLRRVRRHVEARRPPTPSLIRDWEIFN